MYICIHHSYLLVRVNERNEQIQSKQSIKIQNKEVCGTIINQGSNAEPLPNLLKIFVKKIQKDIFSFRIHLDH